MLPLTPSASILLVGVLVSAAVGAVDDELPSQRFVPVALAHEMARAAMEACRTDGYRVSVTVVDPAGLVKAQLRDDGAGPHTLDSSQRKAYTAASLGESTRHLARLIVKRPEIAALGRMNESILVLGGGLPLKRGETVIGGIGVGGAPGDHLDEACARAGAQLLDSSGKAQAPVDKDAK